MTKICNKCNKDKKIEEFEFRNDNQKYRPICKRCLYPINENSPINIFNRNKEAIIKLYQIDYKTIKEISGILNIDERILSYHLTKFIKLGQPRYKINENYFSSIDTEEKAYFLGLLAADGCNTEECHKICLGLQLQDKYMVEKLNKALLDENRISYSRPRKVLLKKENRIINCQGSANFALTNKKISSDLAKLTIISRKSLTLKFPSHEQVPEYLIRHFIRGYMDGDGCLSRRFNNNAARWTVNLVSSKEFCDSFAFTWANILN